MRALKLAPVIMALTLVGFMSTGCDSTDSPDTIKGDDDDTTGDDDDTTGDDDDTTGDDDDDDSTSTGDTVAVLWGFEGSATIVSGVSWTGTEDVYAKDSIGGTTWCAYTSAAAGVPSSVTAACDDGGGTACMFTFDIDFSGATESAASMGDCTKAFEGLLSGVPADASATYGYVEDLQYQGAGVGPALMYYVNYSGSSYYQTWIPGTISVSYTGGTFTYDWPLGYGQVAASAAP